MQRHELEHLIRAAGAITGADEISQMLERWQRIQIKARQSRE
jgi:hypothetical protein